MKINFYFFSLIILIVFLDQLSKFLVLNIMLKSLTEINILPFLNITLVFNSGVAFGFLQKFGQNLPYILSILGFMIGLGIVIWTIYNKKHYTAMALIAGGAFGNVIDRLRLGVVIDYIDIFWNNLHWPAFNIADMSICIGAFIYLYFEYKNKV